MTNEELLAAIQKLDPEDQVQIASTVLDELAFSGRLPMSDSVKAELDRRLKDADENPDKLKSWDEVEAELKRKLLEPREDDWQRTVGTIPDDEISRELADDVKEARERERREARGDDE